MEIPSAFYSWLCDQSTRGDAVGKLAVQVTGDSGWPISEQKKEPLRAYLRNHGLRDLVPALAMALQEFHEFDEDCFHFAGQGLDWSHLAAPVVKHWVELGHPSREEVASLAESGNGPALAIFGLRVLLGVRSPENPSMGVEKLAGAFARGFIPAADILERYYMLAEDQEQSDAWLVRGARAGSKHCLAAVGAFFAAHHIKPFDDGMPDIEETEWKTLVAALPPTGELEWLQARELEFFGQLEAARALDEKAAELGWLEAYDNLASGLEITERREEARECLRRGAAAGDNAARCILALERLEAEEDGRQPCSAEEKEEITRHLEAAAEDGVQAALLPLGRIYARRTDVPEDREKGRTLLTAAFLTSVEDEELDVCFKAIEESFPDDEELAVRPAMTWLLDIAKKSGRHEAARSAARVWLEFGMEIPAR